MYFNNSNNPWVQGWQFQYPPVEPPGHFNTGMPNVGGMMNNTSNNYYQPPPTNYTARTCVPNLTPRSPPPQSNWRPPFFQLPQRPPLNYNRDITGSGSRTSRPVGNSTKKPCFVSSLSSRGVSSGFQKSSRDFRVDSRIFLNKPVGMTSNAKRPAKKLMKAKNRNNGKVDQMKTGVVKSSRVDIDKVLNEFQSKLLQLLRDGRNVPELVNNISHAFLDSGNSRYESEKLVKCFDANLTEDLDKPPSLSFHESNQANAVRALWVLGYIFKSRESYKINELRPLLARKVPTYFWKCLQKVTALGWHPDAKFARNEMRYILKFWSNHMPTDMVNNVKSSTLSSGGNPIEKHEWVLDEKDLPDGISHTSDFYSNKELTKGSDNKDSQNKSVQPNTVIRKDKSSKNAQILSKRSDVDRVPPSNPTSKVAMKPLYKPPRSSVSSVASTLRRKIIDRLRKAPDFKGRLLDNLKKRANHFAVGRNLAKRSDLSCINYRLITPTIECTAKAIPIPCTQKKPVSRLVRRKPKEVPEIFTEFHKIAINPHVKPASSFMSSLSGGLTSLSISTQPRKSVNKTTGISTANARSDVDSQHSSESKLSQFRKKMSNDEAIRTLGYRALNEDIVTWRGKEGFLSSKWTTADFVDVICNADVADWDIVKLPTGEMKVKVIKK